MYKIMMIKNFIKASNKILEKDGVDAITIRKVASMVSVNSATIYNHFDNVEHLKIFSCLSCLDNYIKDLPNYIDENKDIVYNYKKVWECFINHTIENIDVFHILFFNKLQKELDVYLKEYYDIFPILVESLNSNIVNMLYNSTLEKRNEILLLEMYRHNIICEERVAWINNLSIFCYESILHRIFSKKMSKEDGKKEMIRYICNILEDNMIQKSS